METDLLPDETYVMQTYGQLREHWPELCKRIDKLVVQTGANSPPKVLRARQFAWYYAYAEAYCAKLSQSEDRSELVKLEIAVLGSNGSPMLNHRPADCVMSASDLQTKFNKGREHSNQVSLLAGKAFRALKELEAFTNSNLGSLPPGVKHCYGTLNLSETATKLRRFEKIATPKRGDGLTASRLDPKKAKPGIPEARDLAWLWWWAFLNEGADRGGGGFWQEALECSTAWKLTKACDSESFRQIAARSRAAFKETHTAMDLYGVSAFDGKTEVDVIRIPGDPPPHPL